MEGLFIIRVCRNKHRLLMLLLGLILFFLLPSTLLAENVPDLKRRAERGDSRAQVELAFLYFKGNGVPQDYNEAVRWYRKAAEQGNSDGQFNMGTLYENGTGVTQDYGEALKWYRKSAEQGNASAQGNLGIMYANGRGVPQDNKEAVKWCRKAAEQGNAIGQRLLGWMYKNGYGVEKDYQKALGLFRRAAEKGDVWGQYQVGWMYYHGVGVPENRKESLKWYRKAADQGNEDAKKALELAQETKPVKSPSKRGSYTAADTDVKKMQWKSASVANFYRDYFCVPGTDERGRTTDAQGGPLVWTLVRGEESRARKDGAYLAIDNEHDKALADRVQATVNALIPSINEFTEYEQYQAAFYKVEKELLRRWEAECAKEASQRQLIAEQRAKFGPWEKGQWPVPGIIRLYRKIDGKPMPYEVMVDLQNPGYVKPIEMEDPQNPGRNILSREKINDEYYFMSDLAVAKDAMEELKRRPEQILVIHRNLSNGITVLAAGRDGLYRDVTQSGPIGALLQKTLNEQLAKIDVSKSRDYMLGELGHYKVCRREGDGKLHPFDPASDPVWMGCIQPALDRLKAVGGKLKPGAALDASVKVASVKCIDIDSLKAVGGKLTAP